MIWNFVIQQIIFPLYVHMFLANLITLSAANTNARFV